ncbi:MAG: hypothetical protein EBZ59_13505, partial [Planctomycetia bacterium]|nr:hypothetical protein [Planctomycetia bacterium]
MTTIQSNTTQRLVVRCLACLAVFATADVLLGPARVEARQSDAAGIPEDDPFADELNPFGAGKQPAPPGAPPPAAKPPVRIPVPFPEKTLPGEPAARPAPPARQAPRPSSR